MNSLFETRISLSQFLVIYRLYHQCRIPRSLQSRMINELIGPNLINPGNTCYVNAFVQLDIHILPLRLMIVAWSNRDPIISALRLMFVAMSQNRLIDVVTLQILGALRDISSGMLRDTIEQLFCFGQITRFSTALSSRCVPDRPLFFLRLPVFGSSTLMECLNSHFRIIQLDAEPPQTQ
jgi:hypothetical protein